MKGHVDNTLLKRKNLKGDQISRLTIKYIVINIMLYAQEY